jgi:hypothetical protein
MSLVLDPNRPWTDEEKQWARTSGRGHLIVANERRFPDGKASKASKNEKAGSPPESVQFGPEGTFVREAAVYDVGGAALPGTTLSYDNGRAMQFDAEGNGITVEPNPPVNAPGAYAPFVEPEGFTSTPEGGDDIDEDIVDFVLGLETKADVQKELKKRKVSFSSGDNRDDLNDKLAVAMQDEKHPEAAAAMQAQAEKAQPIPVAEENLEAASGVGDDNASQKQNEGPDVE